MNPQTRPFEILESTGLAALIRWALVMSVLALTTAPALAALVRQPYLQLGTPTSMTVVWRTDTPSTSRVRYGTVQGSLTSQVVDLTAVTDHIVTIPGLDPDTQYFYDVGTDTTPEAGGTADHFFRHWTVVNRPGIAGGSIH